PAQRPDLFRRRHQADDHRARQAPPRPRRPPLPRGRRDHHEHRRRVRTRPPRSGRLLPANQQRSVTVSEIFDFEPELTEITERVWSSLVEAPLLPRQPGQPGPAPGARTFTGCVQITGAWEGAVTVHCSGALAKQLTAAMFMVDP